MYINNSYYQVQYRTRHDKTRQDKRRLGNKARGDTTRQATSKTLGSWCWFSSPRRRRDEDNAETRPDGEYKS